ncbi:MAG: T9SS type A sorting domain-containing protein [Bacteroidota bacterium]
MKKIFQISSWRHFCLTLLALCLSLHSQAQDLNPNEWPHLKGYWKFQDKNNLTKATVGYPLSLIGTHQRVTGPAYGDTAIRMTIGNYYKCNHNMAPNGGGDSVNRYTLMFDFKVLSFKKWHTFFQTDSLNTNDGECFIRPADGSNPGRIGVAATSYTKDSIAPNKWYRLVISVNNGHFYRYYINGTLVLEGDTQDIDDRFALTPKILFFADDNQEDDTIDIASVAVFDTCLSSSDIERIGTIEPCIANPPTVSLGRDTILCADQAYLKYAQFTGLVTKFQWSTGATVGYANLTYKNPGMGKRNVWVKMTDVNNCIATDTMKITFNVTPKVFELGPSQTFCKGDTFATLIAGTDTALKYEWRRVGKAKVFYNKSVYVTDSSGYYIGTVINSYGCKNSDTVLITAFNKPAKPIIKASTGTNEICKGQIIVLNGPFFVNGYLWSNGVKQQTVYTDKAELLLLQVTDGNCYSIPSDTFKVIVHPLPPKPLLNYSGNTPICSGDSIILKSIVNYKSYLWNDFNISNPRTINASGNFSLQVIDSNNCTSPPSDIVNTILQMKPARPALNITGSVSICKGQLLVLTALDDMSFYRWSDSVATKSDTILKSGNYRVRVAGTANCYSDWSAITNVTVKPVPDKPQVLNMGGDVLKCSISAQQYRWYRNQVLLNETTQTISFKPSGYYKVQAGDDNCWSALSDSLLFQNSGVYSPLALPSTIIAYPNPFTQNLTIDLKTDISETVKVIITDITGKVVFEKMTTATEGELTIAGLDYLGKGVYVLQIESSQQRFTGRVQKL